MNHGPVLIIDDDQDVRSVMCFALESEGIPTIELESAKKALEYFDQGLPDPYPSLIIVDFVMAGMTGIDFIKILRTDFSETLGKIPIVLSTGCCSFELVDEGLPEGVMVLEKPLDLTHFLSVVKEHYSENPLLSSFS
jgi:CheY-like chemotaxis protein